MTNDLKKRIMRRIYAIWFIRQALPVLAGSAVSLYIALKITADRFFIAEIVKNFENVVNSNILGLPRYIASALNSAEPSALILMSLAGLIGFGLAIKLLRSVRAILAHQGAAVFNSQKF